MEHNCKRQENFNYMQNESKVFIIGGYLQFCTFEVEKR